MNIWPSALVRHGALALVTSSVLLVSVACAATSADGSYSGRTSQRQAISFRVAGGSVTTLRYRIDDRCPNHKRLSVRAWGFPPLRIKQGHFGGTFAAKAPAAAKAVISGTVAGTNVRGTLSDRTRNRQTHRFCTGKATFSLKRRGSSGA